MYYSKRFSTFKKDNSSIFSIWLSFCLSPNSPQLQSLVGTNIQSLWSETPINHTNYPSPCSIHDNATNDTALIASISHLSWCSGGGWIPLSRSIHHPSSFVWWMLHSWGIISAVCTPQHRSAVHKEFEFSFLETDANSPLWFSHATLLHRREKIREK